MIKRINHLRALQSWPNRPPKTPFSNPNCPISNIVSGHLSWFSHQGHTSFTNNLGSSHDLWGLTSPVRTARSCSIIITRIQQNVYQKDETNIIHSKTDQSTNSTRVKLSAKAAATIGQKIQHKINKTKALWVRRQKTEESSVTAGNCKKPTSYHDHSKPLLPESIIDLIRSQ